MYAEYMKTQSACEKVIRRDIARTYPEHDFFKKKDGVGQEALFNVMKAYSIHDREVGYCQGSAFIVGLLLMQGRASSMPSCWLNRFGLYVNKLQPRNIDILKKEGQSRKKSVYIGSSG